MPALCLSLFQGFQATLLGKPAQGFRSAKTQGLLAYLALEAQRTHRRDHLAGLLWPDRPQQIAHHNLSQALLNLRLALDDRGARPPFLLIDRQTIQFNPASDYWLDTAAFTDHLKRCQNHTHDSLDDCDVCLRHLEQAVDLYQGPLLAGFSIGDSDLFDEWLLVKRERLHGQVMLSLERLADDYERRRDFGQMQRFARRQIELDPLRETAHRQLMRGLAAGGQRNSALAQYDTYRHQLFDELGITPSTDMAALRAQIQREEPVRSAQHVTRVLEWSEAPDLGNFYNRVHELRTLKGWLLADHCRLVMIVGMAGAGKTALAARLTEAVASQFERVLWLSLVTAPPPDQLLHTCIAELAPHLIANLPTTLDEQLKLLVGRLRQQRCLLVLDSFESVLQAGEMAGVYRQGYAGYRQILTWLGQSRHGSCVLLTSRERPSDLTRQEGAAASVRSLRLAGLDSDAGRAILREQGLAGTDAELAELILRCSHNPLVIRLVAGAIRDLFAGDIGAFLRQEMPFFDDVRDVLDQQLARLSGIERELAAWLALQRGPITLQKLQDGSDITAPPRSVLEALRSLQRRSLIEQHDDRFCLHNLLVEYIVDRERYAPRRIYTMS